MNVTPERLAGESFGAWFERRLRALTRTESGGVLGRDGLPETFKEAAVLAPFWRSGDSVQVALTLRSANLSSHRGQVSFPGGRRDPTDGSARAAALRETEEELGIVPESVEVLTRLSDAFSINGYVVSPFVGWLETEPAFRPNPAEVARVIVADVERLMAPEIHRCEVLTRGGERYPVHYFDYDGDVVWGLTGGILHGLFRRVRGEVIEPADGLASLRRYLARRGVESAK